MDIKEDFFDETIENEVPTSATKGNSGLPESDYNRKGKLKKVRGRMLWKLLKRELLYYLPYTIICIAILLVSSVYIRLVASNVIVFSENVVDHPKTFGIFTSVFLFMGAIFAMMIFTQTGPIQRYNKNFFQAEGYLTFSIPASMEEHVLAKRLGAVILSLVGSLALLGSLCILFVGSGVLEGSSNFFSSHPAHASFFVVEGVLLAIVAPFATHTVYGVISCLLSKRTGKKKTFSVLLILFLGYILLNSFTAFGISSDGTSPTLIGVHISLIVALVVECAVAIGGYFLEVWYLKNKLDLK